MCLDTLSRRFGDTQSEATLFEGSQTQPVIENIYFEHS